MSTITLVSSLGWLWPWHCGEHVPQHLPKRFDRFAAWRTGCLLPVARQNLHNTLQAGPMQIACITTTSRMFLSIHSMLQHTVLE